MVNGKRKTANNSPQRIGVFAGTFDPVHVGHLAFALQAIEQAKLDKVYFLPERAPRHKKGVEHFGHRVGMLQQAIKPHAKFGVLELPDISFSVARTLPRIQHQFPNDQLVFLFGSDAIQQLTDWPNFQRLLKHGELVIGLRDHAQLTTIQTLVESWPGAPNVTVFESFAPNVSSRKVRDALLRRQSTSGVLSSVARYSDRNWLYIAISDIDQA